MLNFVVSAWLKFFFVLTPFFALTMFLTLTKNMEQREQRQLAWRVAGAAATICLILYFFGNIIFAIFGITVDAFRVGAGALLFLAAVSLTGNQPATTAANPTDHDIAVVPLAIPIIVGPATIGAILVFGAEIETMAYKILGAIALLAAVACVGTLLLLSAPIERLLGRRGLNILSKITGLILAALAAQMIMTGIAHFLDLTA